MKKNRRTLLEIMVENGNSIEEIMKYKDCWDWKETTVEDYQEKMRKENEKRIGVHNLHPIKKEPS
tara:strand:- start:1413 stop:1607 length:195 start_codon:yes stop_codon:yes gene_type:complete